MDLTRYGFNGTARNVVASSKVRRPVAHQPPPPLEQIRLRTNRLDFVLDHVRQRCLDDLAHVVRLLRRQPDRHVRRESPLVGKLLGHRRHWTTAGYAYLADGHLFEAAQRTAHIIATAMVLRMEA